MISRYIITKTIQKDVYALYNSLLHKPVYVSRKELEDILNETVSEDVYRLLVGKGIYVSSWKSDDEAVSRLLAFVKSKIKRPNILYLIVTNKCPLGCRYCFIEENPKSTICQSYMTKETAKLALDRFYEEFQESSIPPTIILYGGEPTMNKELLKFICEYSREKDSSTLLSMITNGVLIDDDLIEMINHYQIGVGVSIDGPKAINDKNRVFKSSDKSVYDAVMKAISKMTEKHCPICLSITVTQDVLNHRDEVIQWIKSTGVKNIYWNLFHFTKRTDNWKEFYEEMTDFIIEADEELAKEGIIDGRMNELLDFSQSETFRFESCAALGLNQISISPEGDYCICHGDNRNPEYNLGNVKDMTIKEAYNSTNSKAWENKLAAYKEECRQCEAFYICGGGCPAHAEVLFGSRNEIDRASCVFYKKFNHWLLNKKYELNRKEVNTNVDT